MKSHTEYLRMYIDAEGDFINITPRVEEAVFKSEIQEGLCLVNSMHLSASVFIHYGEMPLSEDEQRQLELLNWMGGAADTPGLPALRFTPGPDSSEPDPASKRQALGREVVVAVTRGRLDFGPAEQIYYAEFDGRREKRVLVKIIGE